MLLNFHRQDLWLSQIVDVQGKERRKQGVIQEINVCIHRKAREKLTSPSAICNLKCTPWPTKPCKTFIHLCEPGVFSKKNPPQKCHPLAEAKPTKTWDMWQTSQEPTLSTHTPPGVAGYYQHLLRRPYPTPAQPRWSSKASPRD